MQSQTLKRSLAYSLLAAALILPAAPARSQERKALPNDGIPIIKGDCPRPIALTLVGKNPTTFVAADFSAAQIGAPHASGFGDPSINEQFLYTFQWPKEERCCQITRAVLTLNVKSNSPGTKGGSDAGNDGIAIMQGGVSLQSESVYSSWPFPTGTTVTKQVILNAAALNSISSSGHLSFSVQDDTSVISATLQLTGCCLTTAK